MPVTETPKYKNQIALATYWPVQLLIPLLAKYGIFYVDCAASEHISQRDQKQGPPVVRR